jgi:DNA polymerase-4
MVELQRRFGKFGERLYQLCRGIDQREVCPSRERKSVSVEETYARDIVDLAGCLAQLPDLLEKLQARVERAGAAGFIHKLFIKIRFADFRQTTVECVSDRIDRATYQSLMETGHARGRQPVRLLGVGIRLQEDERRAPVTSDNQLGLFG